MTGMTELPLFDLDLHAMFVLLGIDNVLNLFSCVLLEHQILFFSKGKFILKYTGSWLTYDLDWL